MKLLFKGINLLIIIAAAGLLSACSVSREANKTKKDINGNWFLKTIVTEGIEASYKAKIFNEADFSCFIGSAWNFASHKNTGIYTIVDKQKDCPPVKRNISWSVYEPQDSAKQFRFKRLDDKKDPLDNGTTFRFTITKLDNKEMKLRSDIIFEDHPAAVIYNFVRN